jgi:hypothetical protein
VVFDRSAKGAQAYLAFAKEMIAGQDLTDPTMAPPKLKGLGRGLDALLGGNADDDAKNEGELQVLPASELRPANTSPAPGWTRAR